MTMMFTTPSKVDHGFDEAPAIGWSGAMDDLPEVLGMGLLRTRAMWGRLEECCAMSRRQPNGDRWPFAVARRSNREAHTSALRPAATIGIPSS